MLPDSSLGRTIVRRFVNRTEALAEFDREFAASANGPVRPKVLAYFGVGGIGKTALRKAVSARVSRVGRRDVRLVSCDLGSAQMADVADALFSLRATLAIDPALLSTFDFSLARLWAHQGVSLDDIRRSRKVESGLLPDLIEATAEAAGGFAPVKVLQKLWKTGSTAFQQKYGPYAGTLDQIAVMEQDELHLSLPVFLGQAIREASVRGARFVFLFDGYQDSPRKDWLRSLVSAANAGLFLVFSRNRLNWSDRDPAWERVISQRLLERLGNEDAVSLLTELGVASTDAVTQIVRLARGNPFYLEICAELYRRGGFVASPSTDRRASLDLVVERYLDHLDDTHRQAVRACCVLRRFDQDLWESICRGIGASIPIGLFEDFCRASYVEPAGQVGGTLLFRIHKMVRRHVLEHLSDRVVTRVLDEALLAGDRALRSDSRAQAWWIFDSIVGGLSERPMPLKRDQVDRLTAVGLWIIHNGWQSAAHGTLTGWQPGRRRASRFDDGWTLLVASSLRRSGRLREAGRLLLGASGSDATVSIRNHGGYLSALLTQKQGSYDRAELQFRVIAAKASRISTFGWQSEVLAERKLAGIAMVQGAFVKASRQLDRLDRYGDAGPEWNAEICRLRGHIFRFNFLLDEAEAFYLEGLALAKDNGLIGLHGKALTNLAETQVWKDPLASLKWATEAITLNSEVSAAMEVGKALAARSLALAFLQRPKESVEAADKSGRIFQKTGYEAGRLFTMQAVGLAMLWRGDRKRASAVRTALRSLSGRLRAYGFLELSITAALDGVPNALGHYEWLRPSATLTYLRGLSEDLKASAKSRS